MRLLVQPGLVQLHPPQLTGPLSDVSLLQPAG
jgi:hypothetical protein